MYLVNNYFKTSVILNCVPDGVLVMSGIKRKNNKKGVLKLTTIIFVISRDSVKTDLFQTPY